MFFFIRAAGMTLGCLTFSPAAETGEAGITQSVTVTRFYIMDERLNRQDAMTRGKTNKVSHEIVF